MLNYSQVWSSFPAYAPRDGRRHFYSWNSVLGTLGDLIMASGIAADVRMFSGWWVSAACGLSILDLSLPPQWHTTALSFLLKTQGPTLGHMSVPWQATWWAFFWLFDCSAWPPSLLARSFGSGTLFSDGDDDDERSPSCQLTLTSACLPVHSEDMGCFTVRIPGPHLKPTELESLQMDPRNVFLKSGF